MLAFSSIRYVNGLYFVFCLSHNMLRTLKLSFYVYFVGLVHPFATISTSNVYLDLVYEFVHLTPCAYSWAINSGVGKWNGIHNAHTTRYDTMQSQPEYVVIVRSLGDIASTNSQCVVHMLSTLAYFSFKIAIVR